MATSRPWARALVFVLILPLVQAMRAGALMSYLYFAIPILEKGFGVLGMPPKIPQEMQMLGVLKKNIYDGSIY